MTRKKVCCIFFIFSIILTQGISENSKSDSNISENDNRISFQLKSNFNFLFGYNINSFFSGPAAKLDIDFVEGRIGKVGVASFLNVEYSLNLDNTNMFLFNLQCPGITVSFEPFNGFVAQTGLALSHSWYIFKDKLNGFELESKLRTFGIAFPLKIKYEINDKIAFDVSYTLKIEPDIPEYYSSNKWMISNSFFGGFIVSIPMKI